MTVKSPAVSGVTTTSVVLPAAISVSTLSGLDMKPWTRSVLVNRRITGSPFLRVISLGVNSNFLAVISITFGLTSALATLVFEVTTASAIPHAAARSAIVTVLLLMCILFIFLLVLCVVAAVFEHLVHSDGA